MKTHVKNHALISIFSFIVFIGGMSKLPPVLAATTSSWYPKVTDTWHWQLNGTIRTPYLPVDVYDVDLFDTPERTIQALQAEGKKVVCYFSAGSSEDWRRDFNEFKDADKGENMDDWAGERWLDIRSDNVRKIMKSRLDLAKSKGCNGVEPDNVDGYDPDNDTGFPLTAKDQLDYNRFLASEAHGRGMAIGLKNDVDQLEELAGTFDFAVNEQCHEFKECGDYTFFTKNNKPVFNAEYKKSYRTGAGREQVCKAACEMNMRTLILPLKLDGTFRESCDPCKPK